MKRIFISYSHKDKVWKDRLVTQLKELEMQGVCRIWDDSQIPPGEDWKKEIEMAMDTADGAVLMISEAFLASDFIIKHEVPLILSKKGDNFNVFPIIVKSCHWQKFKWLSDIQAFPPGGAPLIESSESEIKDKLTNLAKIIKDIIKQPSASIPGAEKTVLLTGLPQREIDLIGRAEELQMLDKRLKETKRLLLLNGLGGIGKTEVCKRFFLDHYKEFAFAGWIDYVSSVKESMVSGIKTSKVELNERDMLDDRFQRIMEFLKTLDEDSLLVIDNIEDPEDEHLGTIKTLPFKVIANSRLKLEGFEVHTLDFLSPQSCKDLFYTYYEGETDDEYVEKVIDLCGRHTLTLELLARTAQNAAMPVESLYETLENKGFNLNDVIGENVHTFWHNEKKRKRFFDHLLTLFNLSKVTNAELHILVNLAVLPAIDIPVKDFSEWLGFKSKEDINSLVRKGWLRKSGFTVFMHQVIQEVIRYKTHPDVKTCGNLIQALADNLSVEPGENPLAKKKYVIFADSLLQHIHDFHEDAATLANNLSLRYKDLGQLEPALEFQLKDVKISEQILDKNHPDLATSYDNLSKIYQSLGQLELALEFQNKAIEIREVVLDKYHPDLATSYNNLSSIYKALGQLEPALEFQKKATEIYEAVLDKNHPFLAISYNNLSTIYQALGQLEPALEFQLKDVKISEKILDKNHPSLATSYNNLSTIYQDLGQLEPALEFQKKATEIFEEVLDKNHPSLATSYNNLSLIYKALGQLQPALEFQLKDVKISEHILDKNHPSLAASYNNLSMIYKALGQLEPALEFQNKATEIYETVLDKNHPSLATSYNNLSLIYQALGQLEPALEFQKKAINILENVLDKNHPNLAASYHNLSKIYRDMKQYSTALEYAQKAVAIMQHLFPNGHPNLDKMKRNLEKIRKAAE